MREVARACRREVGVDSVVVFGGKEGISSESSSFDPCM